MNKKADLLNFIEKLDEKILHLKNLKKDSQRDLHEAIVEEKVQKLSLPDQKNNWEEILSIDPQVKHLLPIQKEIIQNQIKSVNNLVDVYGCNVATNQCIILLKLIRHQKGSNQVQALMNVLVPMIKGIKPSKIHRDLNEEYKVVSVLDKNTGENGSYSILIHSNGLAQIYREHRLVPEFLTSPQPLAETLRLATTKCYFYE